MLARIISYIRGNPTNNSNNESNHNPYASFTDEANIEIPQQNPPSPLISAESPSPLITPEVASPHISAMQIAKHFSSFVLTKENLPRIVSGTLLTGLSTGLNFLSPYLFGEAIKLLSSDDMNKTTSIGGIEVTRSALIIMLITSYSLSQLLPSVRDQIMNPVTSRTTQKVLEASTAHLLKQPLSYHVTTPFPDQVYFMQKGFAVSSSVNPLLNQVAPTIAEIGIACGILSKQYGFGMGAALFALLTTYIGYGALTVQPIIKSREESLKAGNAAYETFVSAIKRYKTMQDFGKYEYTMDRVKKTLDEMTKADVSAMSKPLKIGMGHVAISRLYMLAGALYVSLSGKYRVEDFVLLIGYLNQLSVLLPSFGHAINQLFSSYPDLKFVGSKLLKPPVVIDTHPDVLLNIEKNIPPIIEFDNVTFAYPPKPGEIPKPSLFKGLSFKIEAGQTVFLVSSSGAGKTTIFNLLYRYEQPSEGTIKINGQDISKVSLESLQKNITLYSQTPNLAQGTVRENICYGAANPEAITDDQLWTLAKDANLDGFLNSLPNKLDTEVGEEGKMLSGGQQQKVAILRGLLKQSSIHLLDEVTASIDGKSANEVLTGLEKLSEGKTTVAITHKLTEVHKADQVIVIDQGKVIAQGKHNELLKNCELYKNLWNAYIQQESNVTEKTNDKNELDVAEETNKSYSHGEMLRTVGLLNSNQGNVGKQEEENDSQFIPPPY